MKTSNKDVFCAILRASTRWVHIRWNLNLGAQRPSIETRFHHMGMDRVQNLPFDKLSLEIFKQMGDLCGGFVEHLRRHYREWTWWIFVWRFKKKKKKKIYGFVLVVFHFLLSSFAHVVVHIDLFVNCDLHIRFDAGIHGQIPNWHVFSPYGLDQMRGSLFNQVVNHLLIETSIYITYLAYGNQLFYPLMACF